MRLAALKILPENKILLRVGQVWLKRNGLMQSNVDAQILMLLGIREGSR